MINIIESDIEKIKIDFSMFENKSILITGASGLIGIYLVASLKKVQSKFNIKIYTWSKNNHDIFDSIFENCEKIIGDITDHDKFCSLPSFDFIIHSSGYGQPGKFLIDKIKTIEINTSVTIKLIEKLTPNGTFLFVSSSEIYNGLNKNSITEEEIGNTNTDHPRSAYIESKRCGESICNIYCERGKNIKVCRLSIAYGPGMQIGDTRVISSLINKGLNDKSIELLDDGSAIRTFGYITDIIEMFWNILLFGKQRVYNVGGVESLSIIDLATKIGDLMNKQVKIPMFINGCEGNPQFVNLSIQRYLTEFKKEKFVSIDDGIKNTIKWQKYLYERN